MRRFVVVVCDDSLAWSPDDFGSMFIHHLSTNPDKEREGNEIDAEEWKSINCARGEPVPLHDEGYHGIVITGSRFNVRERDSLPWFEPLCDLVRCASSRGFPNIYGGCFGCQLVAFALGGEVDFNPGKRFLLKAETIRLDQNVVNSIRSFQSSSSSSSYSSLSHTDQGDDSSSLADQESLKLIVSHGDCVVTLPPSAVLLGCSDSCTNEMFVCGDVSMNIMGVQAHPEFDYNYAIQQRIWKSVVEKSKKLSEMEIEIASESFATYTDHDALLLMKHVARFIRQ